MQQECAQLVQLTEQLQSEVTTAAQSEASLRSRIVELEANAAASAEKDEVNASLQSEAQLKAADESKAEIMKLEQQVKSGSETMQKQVVANAELERQTILLEQAPS